MKRYPAEIVFLQHRTDEHRWDGHLLNAKAIDVHYNKPSTLRCVITEDPEDGWCTLMTQGAAVGSRRYRSFATLTEAQEAALKWGARRFKVIID